MAMWALYCACLVWAKQEITFLHASLAADRELRSSKSSAVACASRVEVWREVPCEVLHLKMSIFEDGTGDSVREAYENVRNDSSETMWWGALLDSYS